MIGSFKGEYRWLSNFWPVFVMLDGEMFSSVEHAYVAAKFSKDQTIQDPDEMWKPVFLPLRGLVKGVATPGRAKKLGQKYKKLTRADWDEVKLTVMGELLRQKFSLVNETTGEPLAQMLLDTGSQELVEGNRWHDNFWGNCVCSKCPEPGENHLGKLLMEIRRELEG